MKLRQSVSMAGESGAAILTRHVLDGPGLRGVTLLAFATLCSCAQVDARPDFERARDLITESTGTSAVYDPGASPLTSDEIAALLRDGLSLEEASRLALLNNRDLQRDFMEIGVSRAQWVQSGLLANPTLDLLVRLPSGGGRAFLEATLAQSLLDIWRIPLRREIAREHLEATVLRIARRAGELLAEVRVAYSEAIAGDEQAAIAAGKVDLLQSSLDAVRDLREAGAATDLDLSQALTEKLQADAELERLQLEALQAKRRIARLLSLEQDTAEIALLGKLPEEGSIDLVPEEMIRTARAVRLDLRAYTAAVRALESSLGLEKSRSWGDIALGPSVERPAEGATLAGGGLSVTLPLFDQNQAQVAEQRFLLEQTVKSYEAVALSLAQDIRTALDRARTASRLVQFHREQLLPAAERSLAQAQERFTLGDTNLLALLESQRSLLGAKGEFVRARLDLARALAELELAVGEPLSRRVRGSENGAPP
ncbi:MAG: TolC family protein [Planctomycetota bacterium]